MHQDHQDLQEDEEGIHPQAGDGDTPFSPPTDPIDDSAAGLEQRMRAGRLDSTHPATDDSGDIDSTQLYNEGIAGAAEAEEPDDSDVVGYHPKH